MTDEELRAELHREANRVLIDAEYTGRQHMLVGQHWRTQATRIGFNCDHHRRFLWRSRTVGASRLGVRSRSPSLPPIWQTRTRLDARAWPDFR